MNGIFSIFMCLVKEMVHVIGIYVFDNYLFVCF